MACFLITYQGVNETFCIGAEMKRWKEKLERLTMALAYAEAGDWDTVGEVLKKRQRPSKPKRKDSSKRPDRRPRVHTYRS